MSAPMPPEHRQPGTDAPEGSPGAARTVDPVELPDLIAEDTGTIPFWLKILYIVGGIGAILLGIIVWLTPIVTGAIALYALGLWMLGRTSRRVRSVVNDLERRLPLRLRRALRMRPRRRSRQPPPEPSAPPDPQR